MCVGKWVWRVLRLCGWLAVWFGGWRRGAVGLHLGGLGGWMLEVGWDVVELGLMGLGGGRGNWCFECRQAVII